MPSASIIIVFMQLNHLHIQVADVARSRAFYERFLGLREHVRHGDVLFMTDDARFDLALAPAGDVMTAARPGDGFPAWFHFGFRLPSAGAVRQLFSDMKAAGVVIVVVLEEDSGLVSFRCADPDGYTLEIYWE